MLYLSTKNGNGCLSSDGGGVIMGGAQVLERKDDREGMTLFDSAWPHLLTIKGVWCPRASSLIPRPCRMLIIPHTPAYFPNATILLRSESRIHS